MVGQLVDKVGSPIVHLDLVLNRAIWDNLDDSSIPAWVHINEVTIVVAVQPRDHADVLVRGGGVAGFDAEGDFRAVVDDPRVADFHMIHDVRIAAIGGI